jgi:hypothetical protein
MRLTHLIACGLVTAFCSTLLHAQENIRVYYVNGINCSRDNADSTVAKIDAILRNSQNHSDFRRTFEVRREYNLVGYANGPSIQIPYFSDLWHDCQELYQLKACEEWCFSTGTNWKSLFESKPSESAKYDLATMQRIKSGNVVAPLGALVAPEQAYLSNVDGYWYSAAPYTERESVDGNLRAELQPTRTTIEMLKNDMIQPGYVVVVAHSEGNLLANIAYAWACVETSGEAAKRVRIVNLANTSAVSVHGLNITHSYDTVISDGLKNTLASYWWRNVDGVNQITTPFPVADYTCVTPDPVMLGDLGTPISLHSVDDNYLSPTRTATYTASSTGINFTANPQTFAAFFEDMVYAAVRGIDIEQYGTQLAAFNLQDSYNVVGGSMFTLVGTATDQDGFVTTVTVQDEPSVIFPSPLVCGAGSSKTLSFSASIPIPSDAKGKVLTLSAAAKDNTDVWGIKKVALNVAPNVPPQFGFIPHYSITSEQPLTLSIPVSDSDGKVVSASIAPNATDFYPLASSWSISDTNGISQLSASLNTVALIVGRTYAFNVTIVDDNGAPATQTVYFDVTAPNARPVASIERQLNSPDGTVTLLGLATDPDGVSEKGRWVCTDAVFPFDSGFLSLSSTSGGSFAAAPFQIQLPSVTADTTLRFSYVVTDESGLASDPATVDVFVKATPLPGTFFDDFDVSSLNLDNWTADTDGSGTALSISGGIASLHRSAWGYVSYWQIRSKNEFGPGTRVELRGRLADYFSLTPYSGNAPFGCGFRGVGSNLYAYGSCYEGGGPWYDGVTVFDQYFQVGGSQAYNQYHDMVVDYRKDGVVEVMLDGVLLFQTPTTGMTQLLHIEVNASKPGDAPTLLDNCRVTVY